MPLVGYCKHEFKYLYMKSQKFSFEWKAPFANVSTASCQTAKLAD